jgi:hypothetical protein
MDETNAIELKRKGNNLVEAARAITISNDEDRKRAADFVINCAIFEKSVDEWIGPDIEAANKLHKSLTQKSKAEEARKIVNSEIKRDWLELEAGRRKDQERINEQNKALGDGEDTFIPDVILPETDRRIEAENGYTTIRKDISVKIVDKMKLIAAVAGVHCDCPHCKKEIVIGGTVPNILLDASEQAIKRYAKASGIRNIPGVLIEDTAIPVIKIK